MDALPIQLNSGINIISNFMTFPFPFAWNRTAGGGNANSNNGVLTIAPSASLGIVFNSGGTQTEQTITDAGDYLFSFQIKSVLPFYNSRFVKVYMFINGDPTEIRVYTPNTDDEFDMWQTYFTDQLFLDVNDVISFAFEVGHNDVGLSVKMQMRNFKLELNDGGVSMPTPYSLPLNPLPSVLGLANGQYGITMTDGKATFTPIT